MAGLGNFFRLIGLMWRMGHQLLPLLENLPQTLNALGNGMEIAGSGAISTGHVIRGGDQVPINTRQIVLDVANVLENAKSEITQAADKIESAAEGIGDIKIPTGVTVSPPSFGQVLPVVQLVESSLFGSVETAMKDGADRLDDVASELQNAVNNLNNLGQALDDAGQDLFTVGVALRDSGRDLQEVTGG